MFQSLYAWVTASASSLSSQLANSRPENDGNDGKHIDPSTPPALMSFTRSWTSQHPGRISSKEVGLMPYSSFGRPATAFKPMLGMWAPLKTQTSSPLSFFSTRGAASAYFDGRRPSN